MLGKLLKHEWKEISLIPCILSIVLLIISVIAGFSFPGAMEGSADTSKFMTIMLWLLFYFALIAFSVGTMIYLGVRFYKTMYTDEGYLTHTLPVSGRMILLSKLIPMAAWSFLTIFVVLLSILIFGGMGLFFAEREGMIKASELYGEISMMIQRMQQGGGSVAAFIISIVYIMIVGIFNNPMMLAGAIAIGQLVGKHRILGSIGAYFGIMMVFQIISQIVIFPVMFKLDGENPLPLLTGSYFGIGTVSLLITVILYFLTEYLVTKRLNLE